MMIHLKMRKISKSNLINLCRNLMLIKLMSIKKSNKKLRIIKIFKTT